MSRICDGSGKSYAAKVNSNLRLHTHSVIQDESVNAGIEGDSYNIHTGNISFSAAGTLIYLKNNEQRDLIVQALVIGIKTGNVTELPEASLVRNPVAGDVVTDATPVYANLNISHGSSKVLSVDAFAGKSSGTMTGGQNSSIVYIPQGGRTLIQRSFTLPAGTSIGVNFDPKLGSGTMKAYCEIICHLRDEASED